ncbi:MAG: hypothetical protein E7254_07770 [Lachnospiraceae bacterium]|nr:hypothetical protein [Lachnospiraceae bacterium]
MRKNNFKKSVAVLAVAATVITAQAGLTGCKLADVETKTIEKSDNSEESNKDEIVGVAIFPYDLYDYYFDEGLSEEEMMSLFSNGSGTVEIEGERIYAKKDANDSNKFTFNLSNCVGIYTRYNKDHECMDYYFDGDGNYFTGTNFTSNMSEENVIENRIYSIFYLNEDYIDKNEEVNIYRYAVRANKDGDLYIDTADGSGVITSKDAKCSSTYSVSEEAKTEEGGNTKEENITFTIESNVKKPADKVKIICMDKEGKVIESNSYDSRKIPEEIKVAEGTEKVVVKAYSGEKTVGRELVTKEEIEEGYIVSVCSESSIPELLECTEVRIVK